MDDRAIGVFDSGLGGLTAVAQLRRVLPHENIIYLGDTARVPYGGNSPETICRYAEEDFSFLQSRGVKAVAVACGTVSSIALHTIRNRGIPVLGVVEPAARRAAEVTRNGRVGILGTEAAIRAGAYAAALQGYLPAAQVLPVACPKFVPLIENGHGDGTDPELQAAVREYLRPVRDFGADTLILGCTHYPLIASVIAEYMGENVTPVDVAAQAVNELAARLRESGALCGRQQSGSLSCCVTGDAVRFSRMAGGFLGGVPIHTEQVRITE